MAPTPEPRIRRKTFSYHTFLTWAGNRAGMLHSNDKPAFRVASPPEFKGEKGVWTPEDLFVAGVDICTMTTFMAFAGHKKLPVFSYDTHAEGLLEFVDGGYRFTTITLRPTIVVEREDAIESVRNTLEDAHKNCIISNSIKSRVVVEPRITTVRANGDS